ncbi:MAG TPA: glycine zipper 2TM domain-containing protein [Thiobacillaceae bacterium]|nr:glycine zipper 2TM domain-containing protein [Thiobacillaceae bacterium]HNA82397.1 glycine zipper 2TM domain-containing protein [Thiobacillaceae bacterium]HNF88531.1 glycine zipper 2TM domain-containing protein [Thiobacillaceae bacterium]HNH88832.1 glycine zipper 2TM domain-containing protein [Thiobacillaceae bacterium]HNI07457.1 glycine zipper 2TM domain-containing protein [Thiobacillaceae bacterium]
MRTTSKLLASLLITGLAALGQARAAGFQDTAAVVASTPVYESINTPRQDCWTEQTGYQETRSGDRSYGGAIIGGIVGGLLGNTIGKGTGRSVATAAGAATGAIVGDNIDNDGHRATTTSTPRYEQRCRSVDNWTRQLTGYNVTYRYQNHEYTAFLPYDPGQNVRVQVNVSLSER